MAIVDSKGRLFGKVNLIDLVVVLAVVAVAGRFGYKHFAPKAAVSGGKPIEVELKLGNVSQATIDALPVGTKLYDATDKANDVYVGTIVEGRSKPAVVTTVNPDGKVVEIQSSVTFDYTIVVRGNGSVTPTMVKLGGLEVKVGNPMSLRAQLWKGSPVPVRLNENPPARPGM